MAHHAQMCSREPRQWRTIGALGGCGEFLQGQRPQAPKVAPLSRGQFFEGSAHFPHSAPGPDGVPYACWAHAGEAAWDTSYAIYAEVSADGACPPWFNEARRTFIPKRGCGAACPITLWNASQKVVARALHRSLAAVAAQVWHEAQLGFIFSRSLVDFVLDLSAEMEAASMLGSRLPVLALFDIKSCFLDGGMVMDARCF